MTVYEHNAEHSLFIKNRKSIIVGSIIVIINLLCFVLQIFNVTDSTVYDFSVDIHERIYVGTNKGIHVYDDGERIKTINPCTSRNYRFIITDNNTILIASSYTKTFELDLDGNLLTQKDEHCEAVGANSHNIITVNRNTYEMSSLLGWTQIIQNGKVIVYQTDAFSYLVGCLRIVGIMALIAFAAWATWRRMRRKIDK